MVSLTIAFRNLGRNRRRVLVTTSATAFAGFILVVYSCLLSGMVKTMEQSVTALELGEVQIHAPGYRQEPDLYVHIAAPDELADELSAAGLSAAPRYYGYALAASGANSSGVELRAMNVEREATVTRIHRAVLEGEWLDTRDPKGIVLGRKAARSLDVKVGGEVVVLGQAADGSMANELYRVRGILKNISERADRGGFFMTEGAFRELMSFQGGAHEIAIGRGDLPLQEAQRIAAGIAPEQAVESWREIQPAIAQMIDNSSAGRTIMMFITYAAIVMVVLNATLMSVFERIREFGIMKAIGVSPAQVGAIVFLEVMLQATLAAAIALATGLPLVNYLESHGWDLRAFAGSMNFSGIALEPIWYAQVDLDSVATPIVVLFVVTGLAALYPGLKAAFISPLRAIHHR